MPRAVAPIPVKITVFSDRSFTFEIKSSPASVLLKDAAKVEKGSGTPNKTKIGKVAGLSEDQLEACLTDAQKAKTLVAWFQENAEADGVQSTPTLVINGETYSNMPYAELKGILDGLIDE